MCVMARSGKMLSRTVSDANDSVKCGLLVTQCHSALRILGEDPEFSPQFTEISGFSPLNTSIYCRSYIGYFTPVIGRLLDCLVLHISSEVCGIARPPAAHIINTGTGLASAFSSWQPTLLLSGPRQ